MAEFVHADIFFFITAITVFIFGLGVVVALYFIILILRDLREIVRKMRKISDEVESDFKDFRTNIKNEGLHVMTIFRTLFGFFKNRDVQRKSKPKTSLKK